MIVLDTSTKKLEVVLAGNVGANQLQVHTWFFDQYPQVQTNNPASGDKVSLTNNTTDVTIVAATGVAGIRRNIHTVSIHNSDTSAATVTVKTDDGGTEFIIVKQTLNVGDSLNYEHGAGWSFTTPNTAPFVDTFSLVKGSGDPTKQLRIEVDGISTSTIRTWTAPNNDVTFVGSVIGFAAGTKMLFQQTNAPTGWTKDTTHDDKALRVVSGTAGNGGATAFTSVFGSGKSTGSFTLTAAEIPAHSHTAGTYAGSVDYSTDSGGTSDVIARSSDDSNGIGSLTKNFSVTGTSGSVGSGGGHAHTLSLDLHYLDVIVATKD